MARAGPPRQLTTGGRNRFPVWTPDGVWIIFSPIGEAITGYSDSVPMGVDPRSG